jgi:hypothetical protein
MGPSADQLEQEIGQVRGSMEEKIVELRRRGRRASRAALIALGVGAAAGVIVVGAVVAYRLTRPASPGERARRLLPARLEGLAGDLRQARRTLELIVRRHRAAPARRATGRRRDVERAAEPTWQRLAVRAARVAATAFASTLATRLLAGMAKRRQG